MISRLWKGVSEARPKCGAEMKLGIQVYRDIRCQLPKDHAGSHRANPLTSWGNNSTDHRPGAKEDL